MKKLIALVTVFAFVALLAGMVAAQVDTRSPSEKLDAGRAYLKLLDQKIIRLRKAGKTALMKQAQVDKKSTIARMQVWKAEMEAGEAAPPPPVAPTPPPPPSAVRAAPGGGLFGWGLNTGISAGYVMGKSVMVARGDLILADPMGIGPMLGLGENAVAWKLGLGGASGKDINDVEKKAIPIFVDGVINIPADVMGGIESYVGGGVNYVVYGSKTSSDARTGSYGGQIYYGIQGDIGLGGKSFVELGYSIIRSGKVDLPYSMKGVGINFGTQILL
ncbi:MAG: hypothetical protein PHH60_05810 [Candidatus Margulisbacteria bacterium]|nr:hypothetical protein [Candidatus Margulisiibacteriota bacterium]